MAPAHRTARTPPARPVRAVVGGWRRLRWSLLVVTTAWVLAGCPQGGGTGGGGGGY